MRGERNLGLNRERETQLKLEEPLPTTTMITIVVLPLVLFFLFFCFFFFFLPIIHDLRERETCNSIHLFWFQWQFVIFPLFVGLFSLFCWDLVDFKFGGLILSSLILVVYQVFVRDLVHIISARQQEFNWMYKNTNEAAHLGKVVFFKLFSKLFCLRDWSLSKNSLSMANSIVQFFFLCKKIFNLFNKNKINVVNCTIS